MTAAARRLVDAGPRAPLARGDRFDRVLYLVARLLSALSFGRLRVVRYRFVAQPVRAITAAAAGRLKVRAVGDGDPLLAHLPRPAAVLRQRFAAGHRCYVADAGGVLAGCLWLADRGYDEDEVRCTYRWPADRAAWDFDVYVAPDFRLSRAFVRLWDAAHADLHARGVRWTLSRISGFNPESLAAHRRLGAVDIGAATFVVAGRLQLSLLDRPPFVHLCTSAASAPVFVLSPDRVERQNPPSPAKP